MEEELNDERERLDTLREENKKLLKDAEKLKALNNRHITVT